MTVRELMDICAKHDNLDNEVLIEIMNGHGYVSRVRSVESADNDPNSGLFLVSVVVDNGTS